MFFKDVMKHETAGDVSSLFVKNFCISVKKKSEIASGQSYVFPLYDKLKFSLQFFGRALTWEPNRIDTIKQALAIFAALCGSKLRSDLRHLLPPTVLLFLLFPL